MNAGGFITCENLRPEGFFHAAIHADCALHLTVSAIAYAAIAAVCE